MCEMDFSKRPVSTLPSHPFANQTVFPVAIMSIIVSGDKHNELPLNLKGIGHHLQLLYYAHASALRASAFR